MRLSGRKRTLFGLFAIMGVPAAICVGMIIGWDQVLSHTWSGSGTQRFVLPLVGEISLEAESSTLEIGAFHRRIS